MPDRNEYQTQQPATRMTLRELLQAIEQRLLEPIASDDIFGHECVVGAAPSTTGVVLELFDEVDRCRVVACAELTPAELDAARADLVERMSR